MIERMSTMRVCSSQTTPLVRMTRGVGALLAMGAVALGGVAPTMAAPPVHTATVIAGLVESTVSGSVSTPVSVTAMPDGRAVVLEKGGDVRIVADGALLPTPALSLTVCSDSERGLLGFAVDPYFALNNAVYVYYTRPRSGVIGGCVNRVSRFGMVGNTILPQSETVLLDNIGSPAGNHNGGDIEVGNDGYLYVAVGDGGCSPRDATQTACAGDNDAAQDLSLLNGKILRVDRITGAPAPGNPFSGAGTAVCRTRGNGPTTPATICQEIFAYGLRNPWRMAFDQDTGATRFYINDVGQNTREEIDLGVLGANYGWPEREGDCAQGLNEPCAPPSPSSGYTQPITDYSHASGDGEYITGGAFVPDGAWDSLYDGGYVFADGNPGRIYLRLANGNYGPIATGLDGVSDVAFVMELSGWVLYYVNPATDTIGRISDVSAPAAPATDLAFVPSATSVRAYDSRDAGAASGVVRAGTSRLVNLTTPGGSHRAALVNLTFAWPAADGFVLAWEPRTTRPASSNLNGQGGLVAANASIVPIDADGNVLLFASATTHVIVDVLGWFDTTAGTSTSGRFVPAEPARAADSRQLPDAENVYTRTADGSVSVVNVPLAGRLGIGSDVSAVALIVTASADSGESGGFVTVLPHGGTIPASSHVNTNGNGDVRANLVVVPLGADGSIDLRLTTTADVIVDVIGSFTDGTATADSTGLFTLIAPSRLVDTRLSTPWGRLPGDQSRSANSAVVPDDALAVAQNLVIVLSGGRGYLTAYPTGLADVPFVSNANATGADQFRGAMAITVLGAGSSSYYSSVDMDLVVDITGYFQS